MNIVGVTVDLHTSCQQLSKRPEMSGLRHLKCCEIDGSGAGKGLEESGFSDLWSLNTDIAISSNVYILNNGLSPG